MNVVNQENMLLNNRDHIYHKSWKVTVSLCQLYTCKSNIGWIHFYTPRKQSLGGIVFANCSISVILNLSQH
jgi:hypothetical protein